MAATSTCGWRITRRDGRILDHRKFKRRRTLATDAQAFTRAVKTEAQAIAIREIDYRLMAGDMCEGPEFGPAAPEDKVGRLELRKTIRPALETLVAFAQRVFGIRERKETLSMDEAKQRDLVAKQDIEAADFRRRAYFGVVGQNMAKKPTPSSLRNVASGRAAAMTGASFPSA